VSHEAHEHIEHAAHESGILPRLIGITIATLGVMLALCSAQLGASRTELISTMVDENGAKDQATAVNNKYRMLEAELQHLHAAMPNIRFMEEKDDEFKALASKVKSPEAEAELKASRVLNDRLLNTVIPTPDDVERFLVLIDRTREQDEAAREWAESYHDAVEAQKTAAEHFEYALLAVEIGIVIASVGLLLSKQVRIGWTAFAVAALLGLISGGIAGSAFLTKRHALHEAEQKIEAKHEHFTKKSNEKEEVDEDKNLEKEIRKDIPALKRLMGGAQAGRGRHGPDGHASGG